MVENFVEGGEKRPKGAEAPFGNVFNHESAIENLVDSTRGCIFNHIFFVGLK